MSGYGYSYSNEEGLAPGLQRHVRPMIAPGGSGWYQWHTWEPEPQSIQVKISVDAQPAVDALRHSQLSMSALGNLKRIAARFKLRNRDAFLPFAYYAGVLNCEDAIQEWCEASGVPSPDFS